MERSLSAAMPILLLLLFQVSSLALPQETAGEEKVCIIITGLGGMPEYEENFLSWGLAAEAHFQDELESVVYRLDGREKKKEDILQLFEQVSSSPPSKEL